MRALLAIVAMVVWIVACSRGAEQLQLVDIKRGDLVVGVVVTGELEAVDSTDIKPPAVNMWNFKIASLADDGAEVKEGAVVVGFDASDQARELENVLNEVEEAKKKLEKKRDDAALARREEDLAIANAEASLRRATLKATTPGDLVATIELKTVKLDEQAAKIGQELARNKAIQQRRTDEAELARLRDKLTYVTHRAELLQQNIAKMQVKAPRSGTVVFPTGWQGEKKKVGDQAWRMETVLQVVGLDKMIGKGAVDEVDIARVAPNQPVTLRLDALPDVQLTGHVQSIATAVRSKSETDPSKVIDIKLALGATKASLRPGMRFRGEVEIERLPDVVLIPIDAVFVSPDGPVAYRASGASAERVKLTLGRRSATMVEVKAGLSPGDRVSRRDPAQRAK
ncbi:MAG: efflux RND transporter periplasmic adaptor subunit [Kofleriaceae bacterium]